MFSGIVGFSQYCAANTSAEGAMKIVKMLNELYTIFDSLTDSKSNSNVYKVNKFMFPFSLACSISLGMDLISFSIIVFPSRIPYRERFSLGHNI